MMQVVQMKALQHTEHHTFPLNNYAIKNWFTDPAGRTWVTLQVEDFNVHQLDKMRGSIIDLWTTNGDYLGKVTAVVLSSGNMASVADDIHEIRVQYEVWDPPAPPPVEESYEEQVINLLVSILHELAAIKEKLP